MALFVEQHPGRVAQHDAEHGPQDPVEGCAGETGAEQDPGDRAHEQHAKQREIDVAETKVAETTDKGERHGVGDIAADDALCR